jgi:cytochrome c553
MAFRPAMGFLAAAAAVVLIAPLNAQAAGNAERGKKLAYTCFGCHGIENYRNAYPNYRVPKIGGQSATYMVAALNEYKLKARWHPTMQGQATALTEQDLADIAAYFQGPERTPSSGMTVGNAPAAALTCAACHGPDGVGITPDYPTIAGQYADYIEQALGDYRSGKRTNAIMSGFAQQLKPEDIKAVAEYFSRQQGVHTPKHP